MVETHYNLVRKNAELIITQVSYGSQNLRGLTFRIWSGSIDTLICMLNVEKKKGQ